MKLQLIILIILVSGLAIAEIESLGIFRQYDCIELKQSCSNCSYVNITSVIYPNSTQALGEVKMTKTGTEYNYSFCSTSALGQYIITTKGDVDGTPTVVAYNLEVTVTGTTLSSSKSTLYVVFLIAAMGIFFLCLYYAVKLPWKHGRNEYNEVIGVNELKYIKLFLIVACYLILMFMSGLLRGITASFIPEIGVSGFFEWVYWILLSGMLPIIICSLVFALIIFISNKKFSRALNRGIPIE